MVAFYNHAFFKWNGIPVQFTTSANHELWDYRLQPNEIISMLNASFKCRISKKHKKIYIERCANKNNMVFRIILAEDYCIDVESDCYVVIHVKPTK